MFLISILILVLIGHWLLRGLDFCVRTSKGLRELETKQLMHKLCVKADDVTGNKIKRYVNMPVLLFAAIGLCLSKPEQDVNCKLILKN